MVKKCHRNSMHYMQCVRSVMKMIKQKIKFVEIALGSESASNDCFCSGPHVMYASGCMSALYKEAGVRWVACSGH